MKISYVFLRSVLFPSWSMTNNFSQHVKDNLHYSIGIARKKAILKNMKRSCEKMLFKGNKWLNYTKKHFTKVLLKVLLLQYHYERKVFKSLWYASQKEVVYMYFSKPIDRVNHKLLLFKPKSSDFRIHLLN